MCVDLSNPATAQKMFRLRRFNYNLIKKKHRTAVALRFTVIADKNIHIQIHTRDYAKQPNLGVFKKKKTDQEATYLST